MGTCNVLKSCWLYTDTKIVAESIRYKTKKYYTTFANTGFVANVVNIGTSFSGAGGAVRFSLIRGVDCEVVGFCAKRCS